jgi:hypothetical protein
VVTLIIFMKIYSLMPFDALNGSLVGQCLILGCKTEISDTFTHSRKREGKITKMGQVVVTGLIGDNAASANLAGDPAQVPG